MGQNALFDPVKRDYVNQDGSVRMTERIHEAAYFVLMIPRGRWMYGLADQGSELFRFKGTKRTSDVEQLFAARVAEPITTQLIENNRAVSVETKSVEATRDGSSNETTIVQETSQLATRLSFSPMG